MSQAPVCPIHNLTAVWKEGTAKATGKPYAFWSCPITKQQNGGEYCQHKFPKDTPAPTNTQKFSASLDASSNAMAQGKKDETITNLAIIKELIALGKNPGEVQTVKEFYQWKRLAEGKTLEIKEKDPAKVGYGAEDEVPIDVQF